MTSGLYQGTPDIERGCVAVEHAARNLQEASKALQRSTAALAKAAAIGDLAKMRSEAARVSELGEAVRLAASHAASAWELSDGAEASYLEHGYERELELAAAERNIVLRPHGKGYAAFPCMVTVEPRSRTVRIDRRHIRALRPSALVEEIVKAQSHRPRFKPEQFIELLFSAYRLVVGPENLGKGTTLVEVYDALTLLPDARKEYSRDEFVRDMHLLNRSGITSTRRGHVLRLPASTGTKTQANVLDIVDERGERHLYFGIIFNATSGEGPT